MKSQLVTLHDNQPTVSHRVIAENTGNKAQNIKELLDDHKLDFEEFGVIRFETEKGRGRPTITYYLNEQQATLLLTYLRNSSAVRAFKVALVKEFYRLREELYHKTPEIVIKDVTPNFYGGKSVQHLIAGYQGKIAVMRNEINRLRSLPEPKPQDHSEEIVKLIEKGLKYDELLKKEALKDAILFNLKESYAPMLKQLYNGLQKYGADDTKRLN